MSKESGALKAVHLYYQVACIGGSASHILLLFCEGAQLLDASAEQISRKIDQFSPQDATWAIWSFARLFHYPDQAFLNVRSPLLSNIPVFLRFNTHDKPR